MDHPLSKLRRQERLTDAPIQSGDSEREPPATRVGRAVLCAAACVIIIAGMKQAESILVPFLLSIFLAIIFGPILIWMQNHGVRTPIALVVVIAALLLAIFGVVALVSGSVADFTANSGRYEARLQGQVNAFLAWLDAHGVDSEPLREQSMLDTKQVVGLLTSLLGSLGSALSNAFLVVLTTVFMLLEASGLGVKIRAISGPGSGAEDRFRQIVADIRQYVATKTLVSMVTGVLITIGLVVLDVDYPILWGLLAFLFNFVPNIGSFIAAVPPVVLAFLQHGVWSAILVALLFLIVNTVIGNFVEPRMMGRRLGLSTLVVFLSLVFWGWVLGPVGMVLSVPLTMAVKIILERSEETRWVGILLGSESAAREALKEG